MNESVTCLRTSDYPGATAASNSTVEEPLPESRLLVLCCRAQHRAADAEYIEQMPLHSLDWQLVLQLAARHRVVPQVQASLQAFRQRVPAEAYRELATMHRECIAQSLQLTDELLRANHILTDAGIPVLGFKGPLLAVVAYGQPAARHFGDLDLLVSPSLVERARECLMANGYEWGPEEPNNRRYAKPYQLISPRKSATFELHWRLLQPPHAQFDTDEVIGQSQRLVVAGQQLRTPSNEDLLLYLCAHGAKHAWSRLLWLEDVGRLAQSAHGLNWQALWARAERMGLMRVLWLGLTLAQRILAARVPPEAFANTQAQAIRPELCQFVHAHLATEQPHPPLEALRFQVASRERLKDRAGQVGHALRSRLRSVKADTQAVGGDQKAFLRHPLTRRPGLVREWFGLLRVMFG